LVFEKNANFFRRKFAKIAENCDHNIDPWSHRLQLKVKEIESEIGRAETANEASTDHLNLGKNGPN
jgi:hypothetical protein